VSVVTSISMCQWW